MPSKTSSTKPRFLRCILNKVPLFSRRHRHVFLLLSLPAEIRLQIFRYLLASPTSYILPFATCRRPNVLATPEKPLLACCYPRTGALTRPFYRHFRSTLLNDSLSLFLVCRVVRAEALAVFYGENVFILLSHALRYPTTLMRPGRSSERARVLGRIRHVWLDCGFGREYQGGVSRGCSELDWEVMKMKGLGRLLGVLYEWAESGQGALRTITVNLGHDEKGLTELRSKMRNEDVLRKWVEMFRRDRLRWEGSAEVVGGAKDGQEGLAGISLTNAAHPDVIKSKVKRKLEISGILDRHLPTVYAPAITALCKAFGGEMWFDNVSMGSKLCFEDGREAYPLFNDHVNETSLWRHI